MKICTRCNKRFAEDLNYCTFCGGELQQDTAVSQPKENTVPQQKKEETSNNGFRLWPVLAILAVVAIAVGIMFSREQKALREQKAEREARQAKKEIEEYLATPWVSDLSVTGADCVKGNYIYVEGIVSNLSDKEVRYYEIGARFYDSYGNIVMTDWTNGSNLGPYESQDFSMMTKNNFSYRRVELYVKEVS